NIFSWSWKNPTRPWEPSSSACPRLRKIKLFANWVQKEFPPDPNEPPSAAQSKTSLRLRRPGFGRAFLHFDQKTPCHFDRSKAQRAQWRDLLVLAACVPRWFNYIPCAKKPKA